MKKASVKRNRGATLTELLVATVLLGISVAAIGEITGVTALFSTRFTNKTNAIDTARNAVSRISSDIRSARAFGDCYAPYALTLVPPQMAEANKFPSNGNPFYTASTPPSGSGWPALWDLAPPYNLNSRYLIIQIPVFYIDRRNEIRSPDYIPGFPQNSLNGFPLMYKKDDPVTNSPPFPANPGVMDVAGRVENLDTIIYAVVPDPAKPGDYQLQLARFPGASIQPLPNGITDSFYIDAINPPQVIAKGIVGPIPIGQTSPYPPDVFSYIVKNSGSNLQRLPGSAITSANAAAIVGVAIDLEIRKPDSTDSTATAQKQTIAIHEEIMMRNNRFLKLRNY